MLCSDDKYSLERYPLTYAAQVLALPVSNDGRSFWRLFCMFCTCCCPPLRSPTSEADRERQNNEHCNMRTNCGVCIGVGVSGRSLSVLCNCCFYAHVCVLARVVTRRYC